MFAYSNSPIARKSSDNTTQVSFCSGNPHNRSESYYNSCSIFNLVSRLSDIEQKRLVQKKAEDTERRREKLLQEQERRYKLCAEQERSVRERTNQQVLLKQEQNRDALRKFYERKAKEAPYNNSFRSSSPLSSTNNSFISLKSINSSNSNGSDNSSATSFTSSSSSSFRACPSSNNSRQNSCRNLRQLVEKTKAALKINSFIIHHVRRQRTRRVLKRLYKLREVENRLATEQQNEKINNLLEQLSSVQSDDSEVVCKRKNIIAKVAREMLAKIMAVEDDYVFVEVKRI